MKKIKDVLQKKLLIVCGALWIAVSAKAQVTIYEVSDCRNWQLAEIRCGNLCYNSDFNNMNTQCNNDCLRQRKSECAAGLYTLTSYEEFIRNINTLKNDIEQNKQTAAQMTSQVQQSVQTEVIAKLNALPEKVLGSSVIKDSQEKTKKQIQCELGNLRRAIRAELDAKGSVPATVKNETCSFL